MKAMILAAGVGSRMKELTNGRPKCLMKAGKQTMLESVVNRLKQVGVTEIIINLHHFPEMVQEYIQLKNCFDIPFHLSFEEELLDTAGGIKNVEELLKDEEFFIIHNCDVYTDFNLNDLIEAHKANSATVTLAVSHQESDRPLLFNNDNQLVGWKNKNTKDEVLVTEDKGSQEALFCCMYVATPEIFQFMPEQGTAHSIVTTFMDMIKAGKEIIGHDIGKSYWIDIGTPDKLAELRERLA